MYIRTDDDHNIVELIFIGGMPENNGFEIDDNISEDIINDILDYKYIDGKFIHREPIDRYQENIETIRSIKINQMSSICHSLIEQGIDVNGSHYSLTANDQIELIKLESIARMSPETPIFYHADGEKCRMYSAEEFLQISTTALGWITYNRTYFNLLKSEINELQNAHDIIAINYGNPLNEANNNTLTTIMGGVTISCPIVNDEFDYDSLFMKVDISSLPREPVPEPVLEEENPITDQPVIPDANDDTPAEPIIPDETGETIETEQPIMPDINDGTTDSSVVDNGGDNNEEVNNNAS